MDTPRTIETAYSDLEMQNIARQIADLRERGNRTGVPMHELFESSFVLPAQLGDRRRKLRNEDEILVQAYKDAWSDREISALYFEGKKGDLRSKGAYRPDEEPSTLSPEVLALLHPEKDYDDNYVNQCRDLLNVHFDPEAIDIRLVRSLVRNLDHGGMTQWALREKDMSEAGVPDGIRALLTLDLLAHEARLYIREWLRENQSLDPFTVTDFLSSTQAKENYVKKLGTKIEPKGFKLAYLKGLEERLSGMVEERAKSLYKDDSDAMMELWRAVQYLRSSKFTQGDVSEFRQSVYQALKDRDLEKARSLMRPRMLRNPDAFTPAARQNLDITEEDIKATRMEGEIPER